MPGLGVDHARLGDDIAAGALVLGVPVDQDATASSADRIALSQAGAALAAHVAASAGSASGAIANGGSGSGGGAISIGKQLQR